MPRPSKPTRNHPVLIERGQPGLKGIAKIYLTPTVTRRKKYASYTVVYHQLGKRQRERFSDYSAARVFAEEKATQLANGETAAISLSSEDQRIHAAALAALKPLKVPLDFAIREYVAARQLLGPVTVLESAKFYDRFGKNVSKKGSLQEILDALLAGLKADGRSEYHQRDLKRHIGAFVAAFSAHRIDEISGAQIDKWLRSLPVQGRSRDNRRDSIHNFFNFARRAGYLPKDIGTAAGDTTRVNKAQAENEVYTPEEMGKLLADAPEWLVPVLVIKAFSGVRTEELLRLKWEHFRFDQDVLILTKDVTKTKQRRIVPIVPNLKLWLEKFRHSTGRVAARWVSAHTMSKAISNWAATVKVASKRNAMRNSFISYRIASVKDIAQVALESGNSPGVIQKDYMELVTEVEAKQWFSIIPAGTSLP